MFFSKLFPAILFASFIQFAHAETTFVTWNIDGVEKNDTALKANAKAMQSDVGEIDVLVLQEVISSDQVSMIADSLGIDHWAISDFSPPVSITGNGFRSLEVAILSRIPFETVGEWDTTGTQPNGDNFPPRTSSLTLASEELDVDLPAGSASPSRGFLRADLEGGWSVYAVHWKSSRGKGCEVEDIGFAKLREAQARGLMSDAADAIAEGQTVLVMGDYNIQAPGNVARSGADIDEDCSPNGSCDGVCGAGAMDGYDDSISLLMALGPSSNLLSEDIDRTYVAEFFEGGAIDHIFVVGPLADTFSKASTPNFSGTSYAGSDHRPVVATSSASTPASAPSATTTGLVISSTYRGSSLSRSQVSEALAENHRPITYKKAYDILGEIHEDPSKSSNIVLFYTNRSQKKAKRVNQHGKDGWNREHLWPQSHGAGSSPMRTDLHHLMPTDATVNSRRGSLDFAEGGSPEGEAPDTFFDGDSFEPRDGIKGDVARAMFYMDARYEGQNGEPNLKLVEGTNSGSNELGDLCTLLEWHSDDPVDQFERDRNDQVQEIQGNRNIFVDQPELVGFLYGETC